MFRGRPTKIDSTSLSRISSSSRARKSANGSARMNSSGWAIIFSSSLTAMPMRLLPWSMARIRMKIVCHKRPHRSWRKPSWRPLLCAPVRLQGLHHFGSRSHRLLDIRRGMGRGKEPCLELRRREVDSFRQHSMEVSLEALAIALHRLGDVMHRLASEVAAKHGAAAIELHRHPGGLRGALHAGFESGAELFELRIDRKSVV